MDEFETLYHDLLFPTNRYEQDLLNATTHFPIEVKELVKLFVTLLDEPSFTVWYEFLQGKKKSRKPLTNKENKTLRIVIRRLFRASCLSLKLMRTLDLILDTVHKQTHFEKNTHNIFF